MRLLGISGSLRAQAFSTALLIALATAVEAEADMDYADIGELPRFDQDLCVEPLPETVASFRARIAASDALVIASPEHNHRIPGVLKNAIDRASRPHNGSPLKDKPVLIVTEQPLGGKYRIAFAKVGLATMFEEIARRGRQAS